MKNVV